jgi:DNA repair exonuclease SbcCD ATPase subunit
MTTQDLITQDLIKHLRELMPLGPQIATLVTAAADRLEELQRERNEARAEVERIRKASNEHHIRERDDFDGEFKRLYAKIDPLKQALHEARIENSGLAAQLERIRPDPSRLEIAAMLKAGWFANRDADFSVTDHKWWVEQADSLIAAAKEAE